MILTALSEIINYYLKLDPETVEQLRQLSGKVILLNIKGLGKFYCLPNERGVDLVAGCSEKPDATICGGLFSLFRASLAKSSMDAMQSGIEISGDIEVGKRLSEIFRKMDIDWEEQSAKFIGDIAAHKVGNVIRSGKKWAKYSSRSIQQNLTDYLQEEAQYLPTRIEIDEFLNEVITLHYAVERLATRVNRL